MSHLSGQTKLDSFFRRALLRLKTSTTSESFIDGLSVLSFFSF
jgi:hypothetical protein